MLTIREEVMGPHFTKYHIEGLPFAAVLHHFTAPDGGHIHDHPWGFRSTVLAGGYVELVYHPSGWHEAVERAEGDTFEIAATHIHTIVRLLEKECWTLVLPGPHEQTSGVWEFREDGSYRRTWDSDVWEKMS